MNVNASKDFMDYIENKSADKSMLYKLNHFMSVCQNEDSFQNVFRHFNIKKITGKGLENSKLWEYKIDLRNRIVLTVAKSNEVDGVILLLGVYTHDELVKFLKSGNY